MNPEQPKSETPPDSNNSESDNNKKRETQSFTSDDVNRVVNKLQDLGMEEIQDTGKTWVPRKSKKIKPAIDLSLSDDDLDSDTVIITPIQVNKPKAENAPLQSELRDTKEIKVSAKILQSDDKPTLASTTNNPPWTLQQFFNGEIDLDVELVRRFPTMPMMSILKTRTLGNNTGRKVAELSSQDGAASVIIDADTVSKIVQLSFTFGSMITLRFVMNDLNNMDRTRWLELMRRDAGGLAFLWGTKRWSSDYMICISRKHFTNVYAFSPNNFEAGVRLIPSVTKELLDWLEGIWDEEPPDEAPPQMLTW